MVHLAAITCLGAQGATAASRSPAARPALHRPVQRWTGHAGQGARCRPLPAAGAASDSSADFDNEAQASSGRDFASSLALMVLGATLVSERLNGCGIVQQLELDHPHIEPLLMAVAGGLAVAAAWPSQHKMQTATDALRAAAGRLGFAGLSAALTAELWAGKGLLGLLEIETGVALSEVEAIIAFVVMLVLTGPRKAAPS